MSYLGIDTSSTYLALALWQQGETIASRCLEVNRDQAKLMIEQLEALFGDAGCDKAQLEGIGVGLGPGSYTGLRVGVATAKGLARGLGLPLVGRPSLEAMAWAALELGQTGTVALDARRNNVYCASYHKTETGLEPRHEIAKIAREQAQALTVFYAEGVQPDAAYLALKAAEARGATNALAVLYL
jgi:tRNA threonylcarbamoyl adenosine modification protein YeaZ